jgi:hypothetical protein
MRPKLCENEWLDAIALALESFFMRPKLRNSIDHARWAVVGIEVALATPTQVAILSGRYVSRTLATGPESPEVFSLVLASASCLPVARFSPRSPEC